MGVSIWVPSPSLHLSKAICLHGTGPETFLTEPDRIGFCLHGTVLELVRNGSKIGPVLDPFRGGSQTVPC